MTKSKIFLYLCLVFIIFISINSFIGESRLLWPGILFFDIDDKAIEEISQYYDQEINLHGVIINEPEQRINQQKFEFRTEEIPGKILITVELYPEYKYGDELEISGRLLEPAEFEEFDYQAYLAKDKIYLVSYYPSIKIIGNQKANWFFQAIFNLKDKLRSIIEQTIRPPQGSVLKAIFLGDKFGLSSELKDKLNISGTRHIVAISGMHMIIMSQILLFLALAIGLWRHQAFYLVVILLSIYVIMIGAPSSAIRAGIMAGLLLLAQKIGRLRSSGRAVVFAAVIMLIINPFLLKSDAGFQLSFIATLSIIYLKPILDRKTSKLSNPFRIKDILTMTLAAQLGTLPVLIFHFGRLSLISPLANILIVPLLPIIMIIGIVLSFAGLIYLPMAKIIGWLAWVLLTYIIKIVDYLSSIPFAAYEFRSKSFLFLILYYVFLILIIQKNKNAYFNN